MNATNCPRCGNQLSPDAPSGICEACLLQVGLDSEQPTVPPKPAGYYYVDAAAIAPANLANLFPNLELLELLGQGGMGAVYRVRQIKLDRDVALKIIRPDARETEGFAERFEREAKALARLNHPNIIGVYDYGSVETGDGDNEIYYLLMEFVDGVNLRKLINDQSLSPEQALTIVPQVCEALQFAHDAGVVHRDIKPENILLDKKGHVKIADFGLAKVISDDDSSAFNLTGTHQVMGTPRYMAPEQLEQTRTVDHRADIYSLGVVFYEMLTGELPIGQFELPSKKINVDVRLDEVVLRALAKEPERRYQLASELQTDVNAISSSDLTSYQHTNDVSSSVVRVANWLSLCGWLSIPGMLMTTVLVIAVVGYTRGWNSGIPHVSEIGWYDLVMLIVTPLILVHLLTLPMLLIGASRMSGLLSRPLAITSSVFAMLPINITCLMGIPVGIWSLLTLMRPDVKQAFANETVAVEQTRRQIRLAARLLWWAGCLKLIVVVCVFIQPAVWFLSDAIGPSNGGPGMTVLLQIMLFAVISIAIISTQMYGASQLFHFRSYGWGIASSILAIAAVWGVGLPIAIYTLAVLFQRTRCKGSTRGLFDQSVESTAKTIDPLTRPPSSEPAQNFVDPEMPDAQKLTNPSKAMFALGLTTIVVSVTMIVWSEFQLARIKTVNRRASMQETDSGSGLARVAGAGPKSIQNGSNATVTYSKHNWTGATDTLWFQKFLQLPNIIVGGLLLLVAAFSLERQNFGFCRIGGWLAILPVYILWPIGLLVGIVYLLAINRFDASSWQLQPSKKPMDETPIFKNWTTATTIGVLIAVALAITTFLPWIEISLFSMNLTGHGVERWEGFTIFVLAIIGLLTIALADLLQLNNSWRIGVPVVIGLVSAGIAIYLVIIASGSATNNATGAFEQLGELVAANARATAHFGLWAALGLSLALTVWGSVRFWLDRLYGQQAAATAAFKT